MLINRIDEIRRGTLIYAKHRSWKEGVSGIVYHASVERITVLYPNEKTNTQNHFFIPVSEDGEWEIRYSNDGLLTIKEGTDES